jgi:hypothetical protein
MLLIALAMLAAAPPAPPPLPMEVEVVRDPITDRVSASATLIDRTHKLAVSCDADDYDGIRVTFSTRHWMAGDSFLSRERPMLYRFDDQPPQRRIWLMRDRGAVLRADDRVTQFLQGLIHSEKLVIRSRDIEDHRLDLHFRIVGAEPAVAELLRVCGEDRMRRDLFGDT